MDPERHEEKDIRVHRATHSAHHGSLVRSSTPDANGKKFRTTDCHLLFFKQSGVQFGLKHLVWGQLIAFALHHLCEHPEYLDPLSREIEAMEEQLGLDGSNRDYDKMRLMDSFLKETARVNPTVVVVYPFRFSGGAVVPKDNWLVIPSHAITQNEAYYDRPCTFDGFRFAPQQEMITRDDTSKASSNDPKNRFSTPSFEFPFWGGVKRPCPGRFYVALVAKMVLSHFIANYDFKLARTNTTTTTPRALAWSFALVPHPR
ncbi:MAG: hypothetical protein Q9173_000052, partial [Seirophora scorigena]